MSKTKFVPAKGMTISATRAISILSNAMSNEWRLAQILGGKTSRTGLTIEPQWVEAGASQAYREDAIPREVWLAGPDFPVFSDHGAKIESSSLQNMPGQIAALAFGLWEEWRTGARDQKPTPSNHHKWVYRLAQRSSRRYGGWRCITEGELLGLSRYEDAVLTAETDEENDTEFRLRADGIWCQGWHSVGRYKTLREGEVIEGYIGGGFGRLGEIVTWSFRATGPGIDDCEITVVRQNGEQLKITGVNPFDFESPKDFSGFALPSMPTDNGDEFVEVSDE